MTLVCRRPLVYDPLGLASNDLSFPNIAMTALAALPVANDKPSLPLVQGRDPDSKAEEDLDSKMPSLHKLFPAIITNTIGNEGGKIKLSEVINVDKGALEELSALLGQARADVDGLILEMGWEEEAERDVAACLQRSQNGQREVRFLFPIYDVPRANRIPQVSASVEPNTPVQPTPYTTPRKNAKPSSESWNHTPSTPGSHMRVYEETSVRRKRVRMKTGTAHITEITMRGRKKRAPSPSFMDVMDSPSPADH